MGNRPDNIFAEPLPQIADFEFDEKVAAVFEDMIRRSVPGYATTIAMLGVVAEQFARPNTVCYDLGCSLGAGTLAMRNSISHEKCRIVAIDNSAAMVARCREIIRNDDSQVPVEVVDADIRRHPIRQASVVVLNFTLQFVPPKERLTLLRKISKGMVPGAALILSEKITFNDDEQDRRQIELHHAFKRANGYSELEISQKRTALEKTLIPESIRTHQQRLSEAGFSSSEVWFQCFNFASILAVK